MRSQMLQGSVQATATQDVTDRTTDLHTLIRQLVYLQEHVATNYAVPTYEIEGNAQEVLLDLEVDGARYLLLRQEDVARPCPSLSPREQEIARMVAKGYPNKTIAMVLEISSWTVSTHLRRIFAKLAVSSRAAMIARLAEDGMLWEHPRHNEGPPSPVSHR